MKKGKDIQKEKYGQESRPSGLFRIPYRAISSINKLKQQ